jgi:adenylyl-sulfate kinase
VGAANQGLTIWLTGLSGAGKSTIANEVGAVLRRRDFPVEILDGDAVRQTLCADLSFSKEDRDTNVRRLGFVADILTRNGVVVIVAAISPYEAVRDEVRNQIGRFLEVFVRCPLTVLVERDTKGMYRRALHGEIDHFTGVSDPYEQPLDPDVTVDTAAETVEESVAKVLAAADALFLEKGSSDGPLAGVEAPSGASDRQEASRYPNP